MYWAPKISRAIGIERKAKLPDRFSAKEADADIRRILAENPAVKGDANILDQLIESWEIVYFRQGETLIQEGDPDDHVFFLLAGSVDIKIKSQLGSIRDAPNQVGELAAIKPGSQRSATVIARTNELAALKVSGRVLHEIYDSDRDFRQRLDVEITTRFRERIAAGRVAKKNLSMTWFFSSLLASAVIAVFIGLLSIYLPWSLTTKVLASGLGGILSFLFLLLQNPAFFWRRCFVIVIFAMIGHLTLDYYVVLDTSQGLQNLNFLWRAGNETEVKSETLLFQSIPYLVAMFLCAFMDYKLRCED